MSKKLIITEKPSVARDFARVLGVQGDRNRKGLIENDEYVISWCVGHLVEMLYPEDYDARFKKWSLEDLPFLPEVYKYGVIPSVSEQYEIVNGLLHRDDIDVVYWAGDSGKEGQTIEENIRNFGGVRDGMKELRVWIDSQTDDEIRRGINEAKPMSDYALLGYSGIMRTIEDYALGINFSRALSVKYGRLINGAAATKSYAAIAVGRVMTCVLGMVVDREREIRDFVETPFYRVFGSFTDAGIPGEWRSYEGSAYFNSPKLYKENGFKKEEFARELMDSLAGCEARVGSIETSTTKKKAPLLFNLAELQAECSKLFKISPNDTLNVVQELYEKKLTTYPRTDARVLTKAVAKEIGKNLSGLKRYGKFAPIIEDIYNRKALHLGMPYVDDSKVTDHYAIIPTGMTNGIDDLPELQKNVYGLIVKRFLSIFYPPAEYKVVKLMVEVKGEHFHSSAKVLVNEGYMKVAGVPKAYNNDDNDEVQGDAGKQLIELASVLKAGDVIPVGEYSIKEGKTSPPKRYSSGTLILAMENAGNLIEDDELREQIKNTGIGTSATRAEIINKLVKIGYLNLNSKTQIITPEKLGEMIYEVVKLSVPSLLNPKMTANWEKGLEGIINGTVEMVVYRGKLEDYIRKETLGIAGSDLTENIVDKINRFTGKDSKGAATRRKLGLSCPACGGELTTTSFGYGCTNFRDENNPCKFNVGTIAGKDIPEDQFIKLVNESHTDIIDGFVAKNGKKFKAALALQKDETGQLRVVFDFNDVKPEPVEGLVCPDCGSQLVQTGFGFSCSMYSREDPSSCQFRVSDIAGRTITLPELTMLLQEGHTEILKGFKSKANKKFDSVLKLEKDEKGKSRIVFDFDSIETEYLSDVTCPDCGGRMTVRSNGYACENYSSQDTGACRFYIGSIASKKLGKVDVIKLLKEGTTETIRGFKSKSGKRFDAVLKLQKDENGHSSVAFDFDNVVDEIIPGIVCPNCGGEIKVTRFGYSCVAHDNANPESCSFTIGEIAGKKLSKNDIKKLLADGHTDTLRGFKSKAKKSFDAVLKLDKDENGLSKIVFDFENVTDDIIPDVKCPVCGGDIKVTRFGYSCVSHQYNDPESCPFNIGEIASKKLSKNEIYQLIKEGHTDTIRGFKSKANKKFDAVLKLEKDPETGVFKVSFDFDSAEPVVVKDLKCPSCGGEIVMTKYGFRCKAYDKNDENACKFSIGTIAGYTLSEDNLRELITEGTTASIDKFLSKAGLYFAARLTWDKDEDGKIKGCKFIFDN